MVETGNARRESDPGSSQTTGASGGDGFVDLDGRRFYRITDPERLAPFFMTIVGAADVWMFISSSGGLTAGRVGPEGALFPYVTDDKVAEGAGRTGGLTLIRLAGPDGTPVLWEPTTAAAQPADPARRALYKDVAGTALVFEESRPDLGLRLRATWRTGGRFGIARTCELTNTSGAPVTLDLLDGFVNVLPSGVGSESQNRLSNLLDAYKRNEIDPTSGLGMYWLSSRLTDRAEPSEALCANVAWHTGLGAVTHLASLRQVPAFRRGATLTAESDVRGERGAYLVHTHLTLAPGEVRHWSVVGDVDLDAADVIALRDVLIGAGDTSPAALLEADLVANRDGLEAILAAADAAQCTAEETATAHHEANVLFNVMRGGIPAGGYGLDVPDVRAFLAVRSPLTAARSGHLLDALPAEPVLGDLLTLARRAGDPDLLRLALEYLPFTFSRRHGDPSRPWNRFEIVLQDRDGRPQLNYQGNWRDIFQNWEALAWSYPEYLESMVTVFVNATTADGYNPYRISRSGIDWEVPEPDNPFSNIGYWSDHQIVYLLRLLEASAHFHPGRLDGLVSSPVFTHADVPYLIDDYDSIVADPFDTITFDVDHAERIAARVAERGADGRLVHGPDGDLLRVTLGEKLLLLLLAKLVNLVPDGGIWMNTQRPEWNDANNALVGRGLSIVTLAQMRRYVDQAAQLLAGDLTLTRECADLLAGVTSALQAHRAGLAVGWTPQSRRALMDELGRVGAAYRARVYAGFSGDRTSVAGAAVQALLTSAEEYIDATLRTNERADGLFHSYNILDLGPDTAAVRRLAPMLEGQVAVLSSGLLSGEQSLALLGGLRRSALYRADQHSYILYPDKDLAGFLTRNVFSEARAEACSLVADLVAAGDRSLVVRDTHGAYHFAAAIRNARDVEAALDRLGGDPRFAAAVATGRGVLLDIFEEVFNHAEFTGRSGSFFAYEGLGSIYWHMVSKLLLAVQETTERAIAAGAPAATVAGLRAAYEDVRAGLGYCKPAAVYGAFPIDPYSHTPAGRGARQPGMTGQVKEEVLTRLGELGLRVEAGCIVFRPALLRATEWLAAPSRFTYVDVAGQSAVLDLTAGSLAFTFCQVPVVYRRAVGTAGASPAAPAAVQVVAADGAVTDCPDGRVPTALSAAVFARTGEVARIEVTVADRQR